MDLTHVLDDNLTDDQAKVSTGNSADLKSKIVDLNYDKSKADLTQQQTELTELSSRLPYVRRAIHYAEKFSFAVVDDTFRRVLITRAEGKLVLTIREADIAYRKKMPLDSVNLQYAFRVFAALITEDDSTLSAGVFQLRHRYNKGIAWVKEKRDFLASPDQKAGDAKMLEIENELTSLGLPLHDEEKVNGFDREFMKLEWMNWQQFNEAMQSTRRLKPQGTRELLT